MPFVPATLPAWDMVQSVGGILGLRVFTATIKRRIYVSGRPGLSPFTDIDVVLSNTGPFGQQYPVLVRQLKRQEVVASAGRYQDTDLRVGPMTPAYAASVLNPAGGYVDGQIDPAVMNSPQEIFWIVNGPGIASNSVFKKVGEDARALHYYAVIRATGAQI